MIVTDSPTLAWPIIPEEQTSATGQTTSDCLYIDLFELVYDQWCVREPATADGASRLLTGRPCKFTLTYVGPADQSSSPYAGAVIRCPAILKSRSWAYQTYAGRPAHLEAVDWIKDATNLSQERIAKLIGVSRQALNAWERGNAISDPHRRKLLEVRDILERAQSKHPTALQLSVWLDTPRGADGKTPAGVLAEGDFDRARYLAMSVPSPRTKPAPDWVRRTTLRAFEDRS